jgi:hypothetical protein
MTWRDGSIRAYRAFPPLALPLPFQLFTAPERQAGLTAAFLSRPAQSGDCTTASAYDGEQLWRADFLEEARTQSMTLALPPAFRLFSELSCCFSEAV